MDAAAYITLGITYVALITYCIHSFHIKHKTQPIISIDMQTFNNKLGDAFDALRKTQLVATKVITKESTEEFLAILNPIVAESSAEVRDFVRFIYGWDHASFNKYLAQNEFLHLSLLGNGSTIAEALGMRGRIILYFNPRAGQFEISIPRPCKVDTGAAQLSQRPHTA
jgi:hypothetical protein